MINELKSVVNTIQPAVGSPASVPRSPCRMFSVESFAMAGYGGSSAAKLMRGLQAAGDTTAGPAGLSLTGSIHPCQQW
ncbi:hypothetical protein ACX0G7_24205 [Flavitalea antarctica]